MALYRTETEESFKTFGDYKITVTHPDEWDENTGLDRIDDPSWLARYKYEAVLINSICTKNNYTKILELGSGPGVLGQFVLDYNPSIQYTYVDKYAAKIAFNKRQYKGTFHVKDLMDIFDTSELDSDYDMVIANDFLEHIANPSDVMTKCWNITKNNSCFFISVPNWRMGHHFIYRGLFDYDNFLYFCGVHGFDPVSVYGSNLQCPYHPKLSSEETMPDELITSWNWYFETKKITE